MVVRCATTTPAAKWLHETRPGRPRFSSSFLTVGGLQRAIGSCSSSSTTAPPDHKPPTSLWARDCFAEKRCRWQAAERKANPQPIKARELRRNGRPLLRAARIGVIAMPRGAAHRGLTGLLRWSGRQRQRAVSVPSSNFRRPQLPGARRRSPPEVRTSDVVLAVTLVALLGVFCLILLAGLIGDAEGVALAPTLARAS